MKRAWIIQDKNGGGMLQCDERKEDVRKSLGRIHGVVCRSVNARFSLVLGPRSKGDVQV